MALPEGFTADDLARAAAEPDRGGLTRAGRALHKHGSRPGSVYPEPRGNAQAINRMAQEIVEAILADSNRTVVSEQRRRYGWTIDVRAEDGRGLRYRRDGTFVGFLQPQKGRGFDET